ncbi:MAG: hypothetical protein WCV93_04170 [Candidatus Shapirobacteria bacterium]
MLKPKKEILLKVLGKTSTRLEVCSTRMGIMRAKEKERKDKIAK